MDTKIIKVFEQLDSVVKYLTPLLPLANSHMIEFFTESHWENLLPEKLRSALETNKLCESINKVYDATDQKPYETSDCEITKFVNTARSKCIKLKHDICISIEDLENYIKKIDGVIKHPIKVTEFMSSKKSYEVETMSRLVASLHSALATSHCVDLGGGRGQLPTVLALGYGVPALSVDCDDVALASGERRDRLIKKQWNAISTKPERTTQNKSYENLNKFHNAFVNSDTLLSELITKNFPEYGGKPSVILTGLHTCGNLGPDSLRIFTSQATARGIFNVPCCYHLLTECVDPHPLSEEREYEQPLLSTEGFPMSMRLKGYNLGRNARMLAAQSIERVCHQRQLPPRSLYYRALLQVIIKEHLNITHLADGKLKRISPKCSTFDEYIKAADIILNLKVYEKLSNEDLKDLDNRFKDQWERLVLFYLIRMCLAQVVEGVILLDRLCFLYESGFSNVFLVKLFDPVLSPRCHGIVALR